VQPGQQVAVRFPTLALDPQPGTVAAQEEAADPAVQGQAGGLHGPVLVTLAAPLPAAAQAIGTPVEVVIAAGHIPDAVLVPRRALQQIAGRTFVEVLEEERGSRRRAVAVRVGAIDETHAEVLAGLVEGQYVLVRGG